MNTNPSSQRREANVELTSEEVQESIYPIRYPHHHEFNAVDGSEFLDDALRMKDQPFGEATGKKDE